MEDNFSKLYKLIWGQCTEAIGAMIKAKDDFDLSNSSQDSIRLLKEIKGLLYRFDDKQYKPQSLADVVTRLCRLFQGRTMTNTKYFEWFNNLCEVIKHYGGDLGVHPVLYHAYLTKITQTPFLCQINYNSVVRIKATQET